MSINRSFFFLEAVINWFSLDILLLSHAKFTCPPITPPYFIASSSLYLYFITCLPPPSLASLFFPPPSLPFHIFRTHYPPSLFPLFFFTLLPSTLPFFLLHSALPASSHPYLSSFNSLCVTQGYKDDKLPTDDNFLNPSYFVLLSTLQLSIFNCVCVN